MSLDERLIATPAAFMAAIWGDGWHSLCSDRDRPFHTVGVYDNAAELLDAAIAENAQGGNIWFGAHDMSERPATGRGDADDVTEVRALVTDIDWDDEYAHKAQPGSLPTEDEVRHRLAKFEHPPSIIVNSGHGFQPWWLLSSAVSADEGHALSLRLHTALVSAGLPADRSDLASAVVERLAGEGITFFPPRRRLRYFYAVGVQIPSGNYTLRTQASVTYSGSSTSNAYPTEAYVIDLDSVMHALQSHSVEGTLWQISKSAKQIANKLP